MTKIVLLAVVAAWAAVLLPPLLRTRGANRPGSSVSDFNRQLSTLQRSVPTRGMAPMRSMARPFTQAPSSRSLPAGRQHNGVSLSSSVDHTFMARQQAQHNGQPQRRSHGEAGNTRVQHDDVVRRQPARQTLSAREEIRRRRTNVLFMLTMATAATLFLAATTKAGLMMYAFAISFLALCGYCYKLSQLRQSETNRQYSDSKWFRAA